MLALTFEEFADSRGPSLMRLAYLLCGERHLAEDLTQATLAKVFRKWSRVATMEYPEAYSRRVMAREYSSWRRRASSSELVVESPAELGGEGFAHSDHAELVAEVDAVWGLLAALPPKQRAVLVLRYYLDLDDQQIAESLSCSQSTVRSNAARGLQALRGARRLDPKEVTP